MSMDHALENMAPVFLNQVEKLELIPIRVGDKIEQERPTQVPKSVEASNEIHVTKKDKSLAKKHACNFFKKRLGVVFRDSEEIKLSKPDTPREYNLLHRKNDLVGKSKTKIRRKFSRKRSTKKKQGKLSKKKISPGEMSLSARRHRRKKQSLHDRFLAELNPIASKLNRKSHKTKSVDKQSKTVQFRSQNKHSQEMRAAKMILSRRNSHQEKLDFENENLKIFKSFDVAGEHIEKTEKKKSDNVVILKEAILAQNRLIEQLMMQLEEQKDYESLKKEVVALRRENRMLKEGKKMKGRKLSGRGKNLKGVKNLR
jgi:hypothetical protein